MNVVFFGSSNFCLPILESLHKHFNLVGVITKPDRLLGRHHNPTPTAAKHYANTSNIRVFAPENKVALQAIKSEIVKLEPDVGVVADYGLIIPAEILEIPRYKTLNIHFSRLPQLRGASPVQYTILLGEAKAWITLFIMDTTIDTGPIVWQKEVSIANDETTGSLYNKLFEIAGKVIPDVLSQYTSGKLKLLQQDHTKATYTKLLRREDGFIPWEIIMAALKGENANKTHYKSWSLYQKLKGTPCNTARGPLASIIERTIRAFTPWPGVWTEIVLSTKTDGVQGTSGVAPLSGDSPQGGSIKKHLKILEAHTEQSTINHQSSIILVPDLVQLESKKPVSWQQFLEGYPKIDII